MFHTEVSYVLVFTINKYILVVLCITILYYKTVDTIRMQVYRQLVQENTLRQSAVNMTSYSLEALLKQSDLRWAAAAGVAAAAIAAAITVALLQYW